MIVNRFDAMHATLRTFPWLVMLMLLASPGATPAIGARDARDSAECRAQVHASSMSGRRLAFELEACEQLDRLATAGRPVEQGPTEAQRRAQAADLPSARPPIPAPPRAQPASAGRLRDWGGYERAEPGQLALALRDGRVFVIGAGIGRPDTDDPLQAADGLRRRSQGANTQTVPRWWDPQARGWRALPPSPACPSGKTSLHTMTQLADGAVLVAGGLCELPRLVNDPPSAQAAFTALSIWDPKGKAWRDAPSMRQGRLDHTATLLADGSVLLAGGQVDPAIEPDKSAIPVLATTERFAADSIAPAPALNEARARHTATLLADGSVLVAGGHDAQGRALATVERWVPGDRAWRTLAPMRVPRHGHTATLLADRRVLVTGGVGPDGRRLTAVEIWEPDSGQWLAASSLAVPLAGHAAIRLADGGVLLAGGARLAKAGTVPWAWLWRPGDDTWAIAGRVDNDPLRLEADRITLTARPDGGALAFSQRGILRWYPAPLPPDQAPPVWPQQPPAAVRLGDGRMLFVGPGGEADGHGTSAWLWDPANGRWQAGARPGQTGLRAMTLQALRDGDVMLLGLDAERRLVCERWTPGGDAWSACGSGILQYTPAGHLQAALLPDGRPFVIANRHEALVFEASTQRWTSWRPEWDITALPLGASVTLSNPPARLRDPARVDHPIDIGDAGARFRMLEATAPRMLWDPTAGRWAYILRDGMGVDAQAVPGGCAVSTEPLARFDPATGRPVALSDPGFGSARGRMTMLVMPDGRAVVAGVAMLARDPGAGFWQGRADCGGFESGPDDAGYLSPAAARSAPEPAASAPSPVPPVVPSPAQASIRDWLAEHALLLGAVAGPLVLGVLFYRSGWRRFQVGPSWVLRGLVYGLCALFVLPAALQYLGFERALRLAEPPPLSSPDGIVPCRMVGVWNSQQGRVIRRIELKDDGSYVMEPSAAGGDPADGWRGRWSVSGKQMVWRHVGVTDLDVNPIEDDQGERFTLVEHDGKRTRFERVRAVASSRCAR